MTENINDYLTVQEAKKLLFLATSTVLQHIRNGNIKSKRMGNRHMIHRAEIARYNKQRRDSGRPAWIIAKVAEEQGISHLDEFTRFVKAKALRNKQKRNSTSRIRYTRDYVENCASVFRSTE